MTSTSSSTVTVRSPRRTAPQTTTVMGTNPSGRLPAPNTSSVTRSSRPAWTAVSPGRRCRVRVRRARIAGTTSSWAAVCDGVTATKVASHGSSISRTTVVEVRTPSTEAPATTATASRPTSAISASRARRPGESRRVVTATSTTLKTANRTAMSTGRPPSRLPVMLPSRTASRTRGRRAGATTAARPVPRPAAGHHEATTEPSGASSTAPTLSRWIPRTAPTSSTTSTERADLPRPGLSRLPG